MPRLSVCLIVRNEERHLDRCLESVRGLADEIVVVDTGSTDRTIDIARAHGARIVTIEWRDDFSLARNFSVEQATGDWILCLDADETIAVRDHAVIRAEIDQERFDAVLVPQRHYLPSGSTVVGLQEGSGGYDEGEPFAGFVDVTCRRLFRNLPWLRFQNRVHEELVSQHPARPLAERTGAWVIHHYGKLGDRERLRAKGEAYLRIGRHKAAEEPGNPQAHYELGVQYAELGRLEEATSAFEHALAIAPGYRDARFRVALCQANLGNFPAALEILRVCAQTLPARAPEAAFTEGNIHRAMGDMTAAEASYRRALAARPGYSPASQNLALLYGGQGRLQEAVTLLDAALAKAPAHRELRALRTRFEARILMRGRQFAAACARLATLDSELDDAEVCALRGAAMLGMGEMEGGIAQLRRSLDLAPTVEAAMNLSRALETQGDEAGALDAIAQALRADTENAAALEGFARLFRPKPAATATGPTTLTIFFCQPRSVPFDGSTPRQRGLGGTESAIVYLAEALTQRGHRCVVLNNCDAPAAVHGVEYDRWEALPSRALRDRPDVVVGVRYWQMLGRIRLAPLQIFWTGDAYDQPFLKEFVDPERRREIDLVMLQSDWQAETFHRHLNVPRSQIVRTRLGAAPAASDRRTRRRTLAYASTPFRGLDVLLDVFPRIRAACPDAELDVFSSMQVYGVSQADDRKQFDGIYRKAAQPGVTLLGSVPQPVLAERLREARLLAYPNHFEETFCIAAAEAQAAGCPVVTSALGALPETVGEGGVCLPGDPRSPAWQDAFVKACVALLTDDQRWEAMSRRATERAAAYFSWERIAEGWEATCLAALGGEPPELDRVATHLAAGRAALAQRMLARLARPTAVPEDAWTALQTFTAWRAGAKDEAPPRDVMSRVALHFGPLRRSGVLETQN
jgi:glycosyltransferase involved in cell wall biosynthesis/thioredoxin-like negative regulator of GroEL